MITDITRLVCRWQRLRTNFKSPSSEETSESSGVEIGRTGNGQDICWPLPSSEKASHATILASSGAGKTILVANAIHKEIITGSSDLPPELQTSYLIVDPKGDLIKALFNSFCASSPHLLEKIVYLNPFQGGFPFNLNKLARGSSTPLDIRSMQLAGLVSEVSTATGSQAHLGTGSRQRDTLQCCLLGSLDCPDPRANVIWALDALTENGGLKRLASLTRSKRSQQFLKSAFLSDELRSSTASRLRAAFSATDQMEAVISANDCIQFSKILSPGKIVLVDLGNPPGGIVSIQEFWANMLVRLTADYLLARPSPWSGHHVRIVIDESQIVASVLSDIAERILTTGRSRGISLVTLSQGTVLLHDASDTLLRVLLTNTPFKYLGRLAVGDAESFSKELAPGPGIDESIKSIRTRFISQICNLPDRDFFFLSPGQRKRFTSETVDYAGWQEAGIKHADEIRAVKVKYALPESAAPRVLLSEAVQQKQKQERVVSIARSKWG